MRRKLSALGAWRYDTTLRLEAALRDAGWHHAPSVWLGVARDRCASTRVMVVSGGRRAAKSTTVLRMLLADVVSSCLSMPSTKAGYVAPTLPNSVGAYGDLAKRFTNTDRPNEPLLPVSEGDRGTIFVLSARKEQASARIDTVEKMCAVIGLRTKARYQRLDLIDYPYEFVAVTANKESVVSMTCVGAFCDEVSRWRDGSNNPAEEIVRSLRPALATTPEATLWIASSPWVEGDMHQRYLGRLGVPPMKQRPDTLSYVIPTWVGNPTVSKRRTQAEEPDEMVWAREYAAIPMPSGAVDFFSAADLEAACA